MLNSKQRAILRGEANSYDVVLTVGKGGIVEALVDQAAGALRTRELIKAKALENCPLTARQAADELADKTGADVVQVIGRCFVLYKPNPEEPVVSEKLFGTKKRRPAAKPAKKAAPARKTEYKPYKPTGIVRYQKKKTK